MLGVSPDEAHVDVLHRRDAQHRSDLELQWEEDVVVLSDDPPQIGPDTAGYVTH